MIFDSHAHYSVFQFQNQFPFLDEEDIDDGLGQTQQNISAEDRVPPECPQFLPFLPGIFSKVGCEWIFLCR